MSVESFGDSVIEFFDDDTEDLLWVAYLRFIPRRDEIVLLAGSSYEVQRVEHNFRKAVAGAGQAPYTGDIVETSAHVYVKETE